MLTTRFDDLDELELREAALEFFRSAGDRSADRDAIMHNYNCFLPRFNFLKNLPEGSTLLDLGAGEGSLSVYRNWPLNSRADLRMLALSLDRGALFDNYDGVELKNFETAAEIFPGESINAVVCCHFIEHMTDPVPTIQFLNRRLESGSRIYLEWPHEISRKTPQRQWLMDQGVNISTTRFDDDPTPVNAWDIEHISGLLQSNGFRVEVMARIVLPHASSELRDAASRDNDEVGNTLSFWSYFGWAQYIICEKK